MPFRHIFSCGQNGLIKCFSLNFLEVKKYMFLILLVSAFAANAQNHTFSIQVNKPGVSISPNMYGLFFEDINLGADGGIYAELIKNRSFEFFKPLMGWQVTQKPFREGSVVVLNRGSQFKTNPRFLRLSLNNINQETMSLTNEGFRGMGIKKGLRYDLSFLYKTNEAGIKIRASLLNSNNKEIGSAIITPVPNEGWETYSISFNATDTALKGAFKLSFEGNGIIDLDMISLFPADTWKGRPGGLRADMIQMLADMKPGFVRFPGGCVVEGFDIAQRYQWKNTIGPIESRPTLINRWNFEFAHRPAPDYFQSFGLGFFEYFQICEDIGAAPLPILNCGMACQFNSAELVPLSELQPYVQDALDLVEFANGNVHSKWGKIRSDMGHPQPFNLKMMGIGNENWGPQYIERFKIFQKALKEKYPEIKLIGSSGTDPNGDRFDFLNNNLRFIKVDFIDEHFYRTPQFFYSNANRYDSYPRKESKVFAGEYASHASGVPNGVTKNNWLSALSEAAMMTGFERNADVVHMASYAPLFAHVDGWQWTPDLIWIDNLNIYGTPNYYVQKLYSLNKGSRVIPIQLDGKPIIGQDSLFASASSNEKSKELIIKIVNANNMAQTISLNFAGMRLLNTSAKLIELQNDDLTSCNSIQFPTNISPVESEIKVKGKRPVITVKKYSFSIIKVKYT
jgi:alpha-L-arabinofuranosidase